MVDLGRTGVTLLGFVVVDGAVSVVGGVWDLPVWNEMSVCS